MGEGAWPLGAALGGGLMLGMLFAGMACWFFVLRDICQNGWKLPRHVLRVAGRHWLGEDLLYTGVWISSALVLFYGFGLYLRRANMDTGWLHMIAAVQNVCLQGMVLVILYRRMRAAGSGLSGSFGVPERLPPGIIRKLSGQVVLGYVLCLPVVYLAAWVSQALFAGAGEEPVFQPVLVLLRDGSTPLWFRVWIVGAAVLVAPVVEEVFFRGVLLPVLVRKYAAWPAVLIGGAIFGLVHGHLPAALPLCVFGVGLGWAYLQTGNLLVPIGMHALFNALNILVVLLSGATPGGM